MKTQKFAEWQGLIVTPVEMDITIKYIISSTCLFVPIDCTAAMMAEIVNELKIKNAIPK